MKKPQQPNIPDDVMRGMSEYCMKTSISRIIEKHRLEAETNKDTE
ncbi:hypothetical protein [Peribacillus butanolivorans]|nr:hypothetical protein [Peribacillus butanolivorans]